MALDGDDTSSTIYIDDLNPDNPAGDTPKSHGDDHLRFIKKVLKNTFPNITGIVLPTQTELNYVDGVTSQLSGNTQTATLENKTLTSPAINGGSLNNTITFNGEISAGGVAISPTELSYLNNLAENVQTALSAALRSGADGIVDDLQVQGSGYFDAVVTDTISTNSLTVNWQSGNKHYVNLTANITSMSWTDPAGPTNVTLVVDQTGTYTVGGWPTTGKPVKWPGGVTPVVTATAGKRDVFNFYYDGTYYYGSYLQNYAE